MSLVVGLALASQGCVYVTQKVREEKLTNLDQDGDGAPYDGPLGKEDCDDNNPKKSPLLEEIPYDGLDNDSDGLFDHANDPGCASPTDTAETDAALVCDDGIDNDSDGLFDHANDPRWATPSDTTETDAATDTTETEAATPTAETEAATETAG